MGRLEHATQLEHAGGEGLDSIDPSWPKQDRELARLIPTYATHLNRLSAGERQAWFARCARGDMRARERQAQLKRQREAARPTDPVPLTSRQRRVAQLQRELGHGWKPAA